MSEEIKVIYGDQLTYRLPPIFVPTEHLRWNNGVLEQLFQDLNGAYGAEWRPIPQKGEEE